MKVKRNNILDSMAFALVALHDFHDLLFNKSKEWVHTFATLWMRNNFVILHIKLKKKVVDLPYLQYPIITKSQIVTNIEKYLQIGTSSD